MSVYSQKFAKRIFFLVSYQVRDCQQISFVTLNRFCQLSKKKPHPLFLTDKIKMDGISKLKNTHLFHIVFEVLNALFKKIVRFSHEVFYFLLLLLDFISADIIFYFTQPHPVTTLNSQNPLKHDKRLLLMLPS